MASHSMIPLDTISSLAKFVEKHQLEELSLSTPLGKFTVCRHETTLPPPLHFETMQVEPVPVAPTTMEEDQNLVKVISPLMGVFYRAPAPGRPPFTEMGETVSPGDVLCIVEAMKVMNEIICETSGTIEQILAANGDVVEAGSVLFLIRKS